MSAKKNAPARDRPVSNAEFAGWVREAIERRATMGIGTPRSLTTAFPGAGTSPSPPDAADAAGEPLRRFSP
jgi:hypothetical protein